MGASSSIPEEQGHLEHTAAEAVVLDDSDSSRLSASELCHPFSMPQLCPILLTLTLTMKTANRMARVAWVA